MSLQGDLTEASEIAPRVEQQSEAYEQSTRSVEEPAVLSGKHSYGDTYVSGSAQVQLGDKQYYRQDGLGLSDSLEHGGSYIVMLFSYNRALSTPEDGVLPDNAQPQSAA